MVEKACAACGLSAGRSDFSLAVNLVGPATISRINREFVGHEGTTDVISFNYSGGSGRFADDVDAELFICPDVAELAAKRLGRTFSEEMALYLVHGILHVSGEEDSTPSERRRMRVLERKLLSELRKSFDFREIFPARKIGQRA